MGLLDNVKGMLGRDKADSRDDYYNDYGDYDNDFSYDTDEASPRGASREVSGTARRESRLVEPTPLITNSDIRSQSLDQVSTNMNSSNTVPDYTSSLSNYDIKTRGGSFVRPGSSGSSLASVRSSEHSNSAIVAARAELEALKAGIQVPLNSVDPDHKDAFGSSQNSTDVSSDTSFDDPLSSKVSSLTGEAQSSGIGVIPASAMEITEKMTTVTPTDYADAVRIAEALKGGTSVVVSLASVRPEIAKRILDFSFGAASMVGASASKIGKQAFYISINRKQLSESELLSLKNAGII